MLLEFEKKIANFANDENLLTSGQKVLLAVSGGADSIALLMAMVALKHAGALDTQLTVAHVNHQLRGAQADADEKFVAGIADILNLPIVTRLVDVADYARKNKLSIETAARDLRLNALIDIADKTNCTAVATAHHADDNTETVIHRLWRGTGLAGLAGIWPKKVFAGNTTFVRPLLCTTRAEIIEYCKTNNFTWRHDHTNDNVTYTRNRIRHLLLPKLQAHYTGSLTNDLTNLSRNCRKLQSRICQHAQNIWQEILITSESNNVILSAAGFAAQPKLVKIELARRALTTIGAGQQNLTALHYKHILSLADTPAGRKIQLPGKFLAQRDHDAIIFSRYFKEDLTRPEDQKEHATLQIPGQTEFAGSLIDARVLAAKDCNFDKFKSQKNNQIEWFDYDKLNLPLIVRRRCIGDRFQPLGFTAEKKIGKFLTAARLSSRQRKEIFIVADTERIIWLAPLRPTEPAKITPQTKTILQLGIAE